MRSAKLHLLEGFLDHSNKFLNAGNWFNCDCFDRVVMISCNIILTFAIEQKQTFDPKMTLKESEE